VEITYRRLSSFYRREFNRLVNPLGLVSKEGVWHLVCTAAGEPQARIRVFAVAELVDVRPVEQPCLRPPGFNLQNTWHAWCDRMRVERNHYLVTARVAPELQADLALYLGDCLADAANPAASTGDDWLPVVLHFDSLEGARTKLLGLGAGVEVVTPAALRRSLVDFAQQVIQRYSRH
jgi:predicted DNA-binding transcriptional regulator YafY